MSNKIGHNYSRDPYPWEEAERNAIHGYWTCCGMDLPTTFYVCPMCEKERDLEAVSSS